LHNTRDSIGAIREIRGAFVFEAVFTKIVLMHSLLSLFGIESFNPGSKRIREKKKARIKEGEWQEIEQ
jgi:hypothetical protein